MMERSSGSRRNGCRVKWIRVCIRVRVRVTFNSQTGVGLGPYKHEK